MVREARFSWDDADGFELPVSRDTFDDLDDFLPPFPEESLPRLRTARPRKRPSNKKKTAPPRSVQYPERRHLADADWLDYEPSPEPRPSS